MLSSSINQSPREIVEDNLMSRSELEKYILDDFRVDPSKLQSIVLHRHQYSNLIPKFKNIPHHRYKLMFDEQLGELHIFPTEGLLREEHIKTEIGILNELFLTKVKFHLKNDDDLEVRTKNLVDFIWEKLNGQKIEGLIVGSLWNFNYIANRKIRPNFLDKVIKFPDSKLEKYIKHRIELLSIEEQIIRNELKISQQDLGIFKEGEIPDTDDYKIVKRILRGNKQIGQLVINKYKNLDLVHYLEIDYLFFNDLKNGTNLFKSTTDFPETKIYFNDLAAFQLINISQKVYINLSWINSESISFIINEICKRQQLRSFYMYGKCGGLSKGIPVGSIVYPNSIDELKFDNNALAKNYLSFCSVSSPLIETKTWLKNELSKKRSCVEMELYAAIKSLPKSVKKYILYYVSDSPTESIKLSNKFDYLEQRLFCVQSILENIILNQNDSDNLIGFPIQDISQRNQDLLVDVLKSKIEILHIDISDGFVGVKSNLQKTKNLVSQILKHNQNKLVQLHFFVKSEKEFNKHLTKLNLHDTENIEIYIHINSENINCFSGNFFDHNGYFFGLDTRDIINNVLPQKILKNSHVIICLESKEESDRIPNLIKAIHSLRHINNRAVITLDRGVGLEVLKKLSGEKLINVICGSLLKENIDIGYNLSKSLLSKSRI